MKRFLKSVIKVFFLTTAVAVPSPSEAQLRIRDSTTKAMILEENSIWERGCVTERYRQRQRHMGRSR